MIEIDPVKEEPKDNKPKEDDVVEYIEPNEGELPVIQMSLHVKLKQEEPWQCEALFHTRCTSHGKMCFMIIDSGSSTNIVYEEMVLKLGLKTKKHPKPYNIHWL